jgi:hypothetical protein
VTWSILELKYQLKKISIDEKKGVNIEKYLENE